MSLSPRDRSPHELAPREHSSPDRPRRYRGDRGPLRESHALLIFLGGVIVVFGFFASGLLIGTSTKPVPPVAQPVQPTAPPATQTAAQQRTPTEYFLVEVEIADTSEAASARVATLRRQYTSATSEMDPGDRRYHVYVGPYESAAANTVADELRRQGISTVTVKPYRR